MTFKMNKTNARKISDYIAIRFQEEGNDSFDQKFTDNLLDYDFQLSSGEMIVDELTDANTNWKFDILKDNIFDAVEAENKTKDELSHEESMRYNGYKAIKDFQDHIMNLEDYSEEQEANIISFYADICELINTEHIDRIREGVRRAVLKKQNKLITPLKVIKAVDVEVGESEGAGTIVIRKSLPQDVLDQGGTSVMPILVRMQNETGKSFEEIIDEKKEAGDELFQYIDGIERRKTIFDCTLDLFVDYSPRPMEEVATLLAEGAKPE